jgi:cell volume regulation protein A
MNSYLIIVFLSICIVLSYIFSEIAKRTNIPSVLMLIVTGVAIGQWIKFNPQFNYNFFPYLEVLGVVGLIMIVLEGALDLELSKEKRPLILNATLIAFLGIITSILTIGLIFHFMLGLKWGISLLYASPLAVISSAIVIPSIAKLREYDKEFLIYESCISDIIGIMIFYLIAGSLETGNVGQSLGEFSLSLIVTIIVSLGVGIGLVLLFKFLNAKVKLFFFISILVLIYALGKLMHLSPLILILVFGLILKNHKLVFRGRLKGLITRMEFVKMERDFHIITRETAFILRTFFFIVLGLTIDINSLLGIDVLLLSLMVFVVILITRIALLKTLSKNVGKVVEYVAPRGLITILLFYSIPADMQTDIFRPSIILWVVIITSIYMAYGLIKSGNSAELRDTDASISDA